MENGELGALLGEFVKAGGWGIMVLLLLTGNLFTKAHVNDLKQQMTELTTALKESSHAMARIADAWEARNDEAKKRGERE